MTPTEFDFTVTIPGDSRLVDAIRQLTSHAAGYAQLPPHAGEQLAGHVERATHSVIAASRAKTGFIEIRFSGDRDGVLVVFSCDASAAAPPPRSVAAGNVTVDWTTEGSRHVCRIRQPLSA